MPRYRSLTLVAAALLLMAGSGQSETEKAIAKYDASEVQMLRDQAKQNNIALNDNILLSTLKFRADCRIIRAALRDLTAGQKTGDAMTKLTALPASSRKEGQAEQAEYLQKVIDKALLGDPAQLKDYHEQSCSNVP